MQKSTQMHQILLSTKLKVATTNFGLLTKIISSIGKYEGLKAAYQAIFVLYAWMFELKFCLWQ